MSHGDEPHVHGPHCNHDHDHAGHGHHFHPTEPIRKEKKPGRNEPCWCGSGTKYKKCHLNQDEA